MSSSYRAPFQAVDDSPPPLPDDIFKEDDDSNPEDGMGTAGVGEGGVNPQLFTSHNLFSAEDTPGSTGQPETTPGGLTFPDFPALGEVDAVPDLFAPDTQQQPVTVTGSNKTSSVSSKGTSTVSNWSSALGYLVL
jgi:hypothetical protein